jgi:2-oxopropyl-CoM reductase (carboxylating)
MDVYGTPLKPTLHEWVEVIDGIVETGNSPLVGEPIYNVNREDTREFDAIIIGGGAAGRFCGAFLKARGGRALIVDKWPFLGGSCPHEACVPHHVFSDAARELDVSRIMAGKLWYDEGWRDRKVSILEVRDLFLSGRGLAHALMNLQTKDQLNVEYILNTPATVIDKHTVEVAGEKFKTRSIVLATGARTQLPDIPGLDQKGVYDFATLISDLDYEPTKCVIIGGSKIAIEYGSFFNAAGIPTTILTRSGLMSPNSLHHVDDDLREFVVNGMKVRGIEIIQGIEPLEVTGDGKQVSGVRYRTSDGGEAFVEADFVFIATGEKPLSAPFVEALGVETDERGNIKVDWTCETSVKGVYAVGDLIGPPLEMFKARKTGTVAARNIMGEHFEWDYTDFADFLHSTYEVVWMGLSEKEARAKYSNVVIIKMPVDGIPPEDFALPAGDGSMFIAMARPELSGFFKIVFDGDSRKLVGAHYVGFGVKNAFQYLEVLMKQGITIDELGQVNELFLNDLIPQLCRLRAGNAVLRDL